MATAALVCGIVGLLLFVLFVLPVVALVLGLIAASQAKRAPGPGSGLGRARAGWILGAIGLVGFALFVVAGGVEDFGDDDIAVSDLRVGDCVDTVDGPVPDDGIEKLPRLDCDEPHDAEVYLVEDLTLDGDEYPGEEAVNADVRDVCLADGFEDYVGIASDDSIYEVYALYPSERSWELGDRSAVCMVVSVDGSPLTRSVEGTGE
jgi:hypothetical protein